jgi:hypothetical protein
MNATTIDMSAGAAQGAGTGAGPGNEAALECAAIAADLERLKALIADAGDKLMVSFSQVGEIAPRLPADEGDRSRLGAAVATAVTALQFQDMATQLTQHAQRRLTVLQESLKAMHGEAPDAMLVAQARMQPVRQAEMSAGSVDLF